MRIYRAQKVLPPHARTLSPRIVAFRCRREPLQRESLNAQRAIELIVFAYLRERVGLFRYTNQFNKFTSTHQFSAMPNKTLTPYNPTAGRSKNCHMNADFGIPPKNVYAPSISIHQRICISQTPSPILADTLRYLLYLTYSGGPPHTVVSKIKRPGHHSPRLDLSFLYRYWV